METRTVTESAVIPAEVRAAVATIVMWGIDLAAQKITETRCSTR